jgi:hypothetical protein
VRRLLGDRFVAFGGRTARPCVGHRPAGDDHRWPAAGPAAWLLLSRSRSTLLG